MREMKDSGVAWIGKIPTKWTIAKAKNCVEIQNGNDPKTEGSIPVYGSGSMSFKTCGEYKEGPSVLIGRKGATLHIPHYISSKFWNVDTAFNVYSKSIFDLKYYFYCAHVFDYKLYMSQTTLPSMTQTAYENMFLPLPTKEEQCAIANQLDQVCAEIDAVLEKTRASIEEYKKLKQAVITQAVTKGVRGDRTMKDSGIEWIGEIPAEWDVIRVKQLLKERNERSKEGKEEPLSMSQKVGLVPTKFLESIPNMASSFVGAKLAYVDDLVFNKLKAHLGVFSVSRYDGLVSPDYAVYCSTGKSNLKYLEYIFKTPQCIGEFRKKSTGIAAGLMRLYTEGLFSIYLPYPALSEQEKIAEYLNEKCAGIDALVAKKQQYLTEIENYKKSLIYEYVTGKKEVV